MKTGNKTPETNHRNRQDSTLAFMLTLLHHANGNSLHLTLWRHCYSLPDLST